MAIKSIGVADEDMSEAFDSEFSSSHQKMQVDRPNTTFLKSERKSNVSFDILTAKVAQKPLVNHAIFSTYDFPVLKEPVNQLLLD